MSTLYIYPLWNSHFSYLGSMTVSRFFRTWSIFTSLKRNSLWSHLIFKFYLASKESSLTVSMCAGFSRSMKIFSWLLIVIVKYLPDIMALFTARRVNFFELVNLSDEKAGINYIWTPLSTRIFHPGISTCNMEKSNYFRSIILTCPVNKYCWFIIFPAVSNHMSWCT